MKISLNGKDLAQNKEELSDFLDKKGLSLIYGGQSSNNHLDEAYDTMEDTIRNPYSDKIYPNYCESTYVNRFYKP